MAMGADGGVHVLFVDDAACTQNYTRRTSTGWSPRLTFAPVGVASWGDLALDRAGTPVAVFDAPSGGSHGIEWARLDSATASPVLGWVALPTALDSFGTPSVVFDDKNTMHVTYHDGYDHQILYSSGLPVSPSAHFSQAVISGSTTAEGWSHIAVDSPGGLFIAYSLNIGDSKSRAYLGQSDGGPFTALPISTSAEDVDFEGLNLAIDTEGAPHVVYFEHFSIRFCTSRRIDCGEPVSVRACPFFVAPTPASAMGRATTPGRVRCTRRWACCS